MTDVNVTLQSVRGITQISLRPLLYELKILTKDREIRRLGDVINYAQEDFITEVERQLNENGSIRIIVLKARQLGISTIIEGIIFVLSIMFRDFQSLIISHQSESSEHILTMTKRYWNTYLWKDMHDEQYNGKKQLAWSDLESNIVIGTAKNTGSGRSKTLHALHASEVAFWDDPDTLISGLRQAIPSVGITLIIYESTANGVGNFFHKNWEEASTNQSELVPKFYPWYEHPEYSAQYLPVHQQGRFAMLGELDDEEKTLRAMGISDARLIWRRYALAELCNGDINYLHQEYPTTPHEAFLSTGRNVLNVNNLMAHYQEMRPRVGFLRRGSGDTIHFDEHPDGYLKVFRFPAKDMNWGIYQIGGDPTHTVAGDKACAHVINRRTLEQSAVVSLHTDAIEFAKILDLLGRWYNTACIAPEKEGPGYATVGHLLGAGYPLVWESQKVDKTPGKVSQDTFGWGTNRTTKAAAIQMLVNCFAQNLQRIGNNTYGLLIHDPETFIELRDYVSDEKGGYCNGNGTLFDDRVMALAIAVYTHFIDPPVPPYEPDGSAHEVASEIIQHVVVEPSAQMQMELNKVPTIERGHRTIEVIDETPAPWEDWDQ